MQPNSEIPLSPVKRRHIIRESEETDEEMTLNAFLKVRVQIRQPSQEHISKLMATPVTAGRTRVGFPFRLFGPLFQDLAPRN